ncbi:hypothetical protein DL762_001092 [Monosporascus cannonballus]|uniref:Ribonuclease n=1 Tax=Monosporascus cannonballus TaxID=155416 RepID=A0ABY0HJQ2_9PEZI|nr:hypothetical protein DL762_001092 [Monosporascus cannonballus]
MEDTPIEETPDLALETPPSSSTSYIPPSIDAAATLAGESYTYFSPVPASLLPPTTTTSASASATTSSEGPRGPPCVLGVDEAGRGPVLGPMVYGVFYLPAELSERLLKERHRFDDSKVLTPAVRTQLMRELCTPPSHSSDPALAPAEPTLHTHAGYAIASLSARSIGANMLRSGSSYNLNAQAQDATADLVRGVMARGVDVREIYVDTVGPPAAYQARLQRLFPTARVTVAKKADSLYPCVSAASVCAKVTRDAALGVLYEGRSRAGAGSRKRKLREGEGEGQSEGGEKRRRGGEEEEEEEEGGEGRGEEQEEQGGGAGYPSDARCTAWLRRNMHPVFGWGPECRFSWGTARDLLEGKGGVRVEWPAVADDDDEGMSRLTDFFVDAGAREKDADELGSWFGTPAGLEAF